LAQDHLGVDARSDVGSAMAVPSQALSLLVLGLARLGLASPGDKDPAKSLRGDARWATSMVGAAYDPPPAPGNYSFMATSTRYGLNQFTSCDMDSGKLVQGTDYLPVASAQAMQNMFPGGEGACCRCGVAGPGTDGSQTAGMGCGTCAKGRFIRQLPRGYYIWTPEESEIFHKEYDIVVVDICPHMDNPVWCPTTPAETNEFGVHNHFDFALPPPNFDNFYFAFTPAPCSEKMQKRIEMMSTCHP